MCVDVTKSSPTRVLVELMKKLVKLRIVNSCDESSRPNNDSDYKWILKTSEERDEATHKAAMSLKFEKYKHIVRVCDVLSEQAKWRPRVAVVEMLCASGALNLPKLVGMVCIQYECELSFCVWEYHEAS